MTAEHTNNAPRGVRSSDGLDINEVDDGLVIYDGRADRVHYLNVTAGVVFALCTGEHDESELPALTRAALESDDISDADVIECVAKLRAEGLIV